VAWLYIITFCSDSLPEQMDPRGDVEKWSISPSTVVSSSVTELHCSLQCWTLLASDGENVQ